MDKEKNNILILTLGTGLVTKNNVKFEKYIDSMINITNQTYNWNVSDTLTQNGLYKVWSKKFD